MLTMVFTDLVNSTAVKASLTGGDLSQRNQNYLETILSPHRARIQQFATQFDGRLVDQIGDSFFLGFRSVVQAARFAVNVQKNHFLEPIDTPFGPVRVRMGLHTGEPLADPDGSGRLVGHEVDYAARLTSLAEGGQILLSHATSALLHQAMIDETASHPHGDRELKGIGRVPIFELLFEGKLPQALRESAFAPENLPPKPPRVTGRDEVIADLRARLHAGGVVVLKGEGGMGKTTIALALAHELLFAGEAPGGIAWLNCETAPSFHDCLHEAAGIVFGDRAENDTPAILGPRILTHLRERGGVLIFDNFETIAHDVNLIRWLATVRPPARVLLTTREVPPGLAGHVTLIHELPHADAVRLFLARAADAGLAEALDECVVDELCRAIGDHPLSVDILAARAARTPIARLLEQLRKGLSVLDARGDPTRPDRHQSARACIAGSVAELSPHANDLLRTFSVLPTAFGYDVLTSIMNSDDCDDAAEELVSVSLWRLCGNVYKLHPLVRQYATEQLGTGPERTAAERAAVVGLTRCLVAQEANVVPGPRFAERSKVYLAWCSSQLANVLAAAELAERHQQWDQIPQLARGMEFFWNTRGYWPLAENLGRKVLLAAEQLHDPMTEAFGHDYLGFVQRHQGRDDEAIASFLRALAIYDTHPDTQNRRPLTLARLGKGMTVLARYAEADGYIRAAIDGYRAAGNRNGEATAMVYWGQNQKFLREWPSAVEMFRTSLTMARELGNEPLEREILYQLGDTLIQLTEYAEAEGHLQRSVELAKLLGNEDAEAKAISGLGTIALKAADYDTARQRLQHALALHRRTGFRNREGRALRRLSEVELATGNRPLAIWYAQQAVAVLKDVQAPEARQKAEQYLKTLQE